MQAVLVVMAMQAVQGQTCDNSCGSGWVSDGDCDDGGMGAEYSICYCGSDCLDCGPRSSPCVGGQWSPTVPPSPPPLPAFPREVAKPRSDRETTPVFFYMWPVLLPVVCVLCTLHHAQSIDRANARAAAEDRRVRASAGSPAAVALAVAHPLPQPGLPAVPQVAIATAVPVAGVQPTVTGTAVNPSPVTEELERLAGLRAAGMLTESEFEQAKARVLGTSSEVQMREQPHEQPMMARPAFGGLFSAGGRAVPVAQAV